MQRRTWRSAAAITIIGSAFILACPGSAPLAVNPSGSCRAEGDGSRAGYHVATNSEWLPDCQNPLEREYFRVFAQSATSTYMIPRPDGSPYLQPVCADPSHALRPLVDRYALCDAADSEAKVNLANDMLPADALDLARYMHGQLRFEVTDDFAGLSPYPFPSDIIDACELHPAENSAEFEAICKRERDRLKSGFDIGFSYTGPGAVELATRLNELYGIAD